MTSLQSFRNIRNVPRYVFGKGSSRCVGDLVDSLRQDDISSGVSRAPVFLVDSFFDGNAEFLTSVGVRAADGLRFVATDEEPTTDYVDALIDELRRSGFTHPCVIVGVGGGITLDTAKALANLFTNPGKASDYQGWDLVQVPGIYKIGVPTISGTGAESSRTCVLTNHDTGLKLGMNSDHTIFDQLVLDPDLPLTVDRNQYFHTGMDAYIHCVESLAGRYRNPIGDALSGAVLDLCRRVFLEGDMMSDDNRERLMVASYLGGSALATSFVGLVHPMSAGLSVVLGLHHGVSNCIALNALEDYYPEACEEFRLMMHRQGVEIPKGVCEDLSDTDFDALCDAASLHEKPLANALGRDYRSELTRERIKELYSRM